MTFTVKTGCTGRNKEETDIALLVRQLTSQNLKHLKCLTLITRPFCKYQVIVRFQVYLADSCLLTTLFTIVFDSMENERLSVHSRYVDYQFSNSRLSLYINFVMLQILSMHLSDGKTLAV